MPLRLGSELLEQTLAEKQIKINMQTCVPSTPIESFFLSQNTFLTCGLIPNSVLKTCSSAAFKPLLMNVWYNRGGASSILRRMLSLLNSVKSDTTWALVEKNTSAMCVPCGPIFTRCVISLRKDFIMSNSGRRMLAEESTTKARSMTHLKSSEKEKEKEKR